VLGRICSESSDVSLLPGLVTVLLVGRIRDFSV
jgi:hypothetical protein